MTGRRTRARPGRPPGRAPAPATPRRRPGPAASGRPGPPPPRRPRPGSGRPRTGARRGRSGRSTAAISRAHEIVIAPVAVAASRRGWRASRRIWRTAALASLLPRRVLAASHLAVVAWPSASWSSAASNRRISPLAAAPSREVIAPSCSRASPRPGPSRSAAAGGVQVRAAAAAGDPERVRDAREAPAGGGQGASRSVWRAHHEPPPSAGRREHADEAHAVAGNCRGGRLRACGHGTALRLSLAAAPAIRRAGIREGRRALGGRVREGLPSPPHITRSIDDKEIAGWHDHLFDFLSPTPST